MRLCCNFCLRHDGRDAARRAGSSAAADFSYKTVGGRESKTIRCVAKPSVSPPARRLANANQSLVICVDYRRHLANMNKPKCVATQLKVQHVA